MQHHYSSTSPVAVAVSGGADSLYSLIMLKEAGIPVIAVHGLFISEETGTPGAEDENPSGGQVEGIAQACRTLDVPFHLVDLREAFLTQVVRPFVEAYAQGETPNPCVLCNAAIKFGLLLEKAGNLGATRLATGHYARLVNAEQGKKMGGFLSLSPPSLLQGKDPTKDQSYFLALVPRDHLQNVMFPLGETKKTEVLAYLAGRGIVPPAPKESQEVCFIPANAYQDMLPRMAERMGIALSGPGPMCLEGEKMGTHKGLWRYTEGQRRGLGVAWKEPLHVIAKNKQTNALLLGRKEEAVTTGCLCGAVNLLLPPEEWPDTVFVKARYREQPKPAKVTLVQSEPRRSWWGFSDSGACLDIRFLEKEGAVAQGQLAAVYAPVPGVFEEDGRPVLRLLAGGLVTKVKRP